MAVDKRGARGNLHGDTDNDSESEEEQFIDLCPSWMGQVFQVQYILKVFLKHDSFFSEKQSCVNLPLRIMSTARTDPSFEPWRVPNDWNPYQGTEEPTYIFLQNPDEKPEYMTRYIDRNWNKWEANIEPILIAAEEEERRRMKRLNSEINMMTEDSFEELKLPESNQSSPVKAKEEMTPEQVVEEQN